MIEKKKYDSIFDIDAYEIQQYQQNRYPLLFIDRVVEAVPGEYAIGYKNFSFNEWFFPVHFEDEPNVPGFVQMEALTQMFLMTFLTMPENKGKKTAFITSKVNFRKKIIPGDRLDIETTLDSFRRGLAKGKAIGKVNDECACDAELVIAIPDVMRNYMPSVSRRSEA